MHVLSGRGVQFHVIRLADNSPPAEPAEREDCDTRRMVAGVTMVGLSIVALVVNRLYYAMAWLPDYYAANFDGDPPVVVPWDVAVRYATHTAIGGALTLAVILLFFGGFIVVLWGGQIAGLLRRAGRH